MGNTLSILNLPRTRCGARQSSKKRVFESAAAMIADDQAYLESGEVFSALISRERLGSTAMGNGIAIPHCRIANCAEPVGALITLADPVDFDAHDGQGVDVVFVLLVPEDAHQEHLDVLALLARMFSTPENLIRLRAAEDDQALYQTATQILGDLTTAPA